MTGHARIPLIAIIIASACAPAVKPETAPKPDADSATASAPATKNRTEKTSSTPKSTPSTRGTASSAKGNVAPKGKTSANEKPSTTAKAPSTEKSSPSAKASGTEKSSASAKAAPTEKAVAIEKPLILEKAAPTEKDDARETTERTNRLAAAMALESAGVVEADIVSVDRPALSVPVEASWDIEVKEYLSHDRVEYYVRRFTGSSRSTIVSWMQRGRRYEPMIRKTFREHGVPEDMYYLGLVESGYNPHAYSRAAAVGMWQFMTATARGVGLRVDWWVDERRDPMKSTKAAARFLSSLHEQFGSYYLAAAAYNGGPARISRGLTRYAGSVDDSEGDDQFFALAETRALRRETSNYVPQLIAAAAIGKEAWKYGIRLDNVPPYAYDSVLVPPRTAVAALTYVTGAHLDSLRDHNPHLLRGATPPDGETWVRVPRGHAPATFATDLMVLPDSVRMAWTPVKVKKATTITAMAKAHGMTSTQLRWYNPKFKGSRIGIGVTINVPTKLAISGAFAVGDPSVERYGATVNGVHVVRRGETLSHIAARNGTTVSRLMAINRLKKNVIFPGQAIRVRASASKKAS
jgi:membrane-bound lytic murein transglycosylase D